jgi:hypothetical protein
MSIIVPPFVAYQAPLVPLRGLWNKSPPEGDRYVTGEIDWGITTSGKLGVQISLSGNSPVAISQIIALAVDNSRSGSPAQFIFTDSGFILNVPARNQGTYPVFTNALNFFVVAPASALGDVTAFTVLNSMPPPIAIQPSDLQDKALAVGVNLAVNGSTQVVPATVNGTLEAFDFDATLLAPATAASCTVSLVDGLGAVIWQRSLFAGAPPVQITSTLVGLSLRFFGGLRLVVAGTTITSGVINLNLYYAVP